MKPTLITTRNLVRLLTNILAIALAISAQATPCEIINSDFSAGLAGWTDESEGPGLPHGIVEIVDFQGRDAMLHLESRAGSNYYLFLTQTVDLDGCDLTDMVLSWDWLGLEVERNYGLAAVNVEFYDNDGERRGVYFVRRHTGDFQPYECDQVIDDFLQDNPGVAVGCQQEIGTTFFERKFLVLSEELFAGLDGPALHPSQVAAVKIVLESYNNAGAGANVYFDRVVLESGPLAACAVANGDFSQGETFWMNEDNGPGLDSRDRKYASKSVVLNLDSRTSGNYYLLRSQVVDLRGCDVSQQTLAWRWKLAEIESPYGLAAVFVRFFDQSSQRLGDFHVRRHTGDFPLYDCDQVITDFQQDNPGMAVGCSEATGTFFDWQTDEITFDNNFFSDLEGAVVDPTDVAFLKIYLESYNNAGTGVDAYFDDFAIYGDIFTPVGEYDAPVAAPDGLALGQNHPNPFNPQTTIPYYLSQTAAVRLEVYNVRGQRVTVLLDETQDAGRHSVTWRGIDDQGRDVPSGIYHARLATEQGIRIQQMILIK